MTTFDISRYPNYWGTVSQEEYEKRFNSRYTYADTENIAGYGVNNPYLPPLAQPSWILSIVDRHVLLTFSYPLLLTFAGLNAFIQGLYNGDTWDGYWYNNSVAVGNELYPTGLNKYYDLYSIVGFFNYISGWLWIGVTNLITPFTLFVPFDVWEAIINGYSWENIWMAFLPYPVLNLGNLKGEGSWPLL